MVHVTPYLSVVYAQLLEFAHSVGMDIAERWPTTEANLGFHKTSYSADTILLPSDRRVASIVRFVLRALFRPHAWKEMYPESIRATLTPRWAREWAWRKTLQQHSKQWCTCYPTRVTFQ